MTTTLAWSLISEPTPQTLILIAILLLLGILIGSVGNLLWSAIRRSGIIPKVIRMLKGRVSTEHGNGFDHRWNGLNYNQIQQEPDFSEYKQQISRDYGATWEDMPDGLTLQEFMARDMEIQHVPNDYADWTPTNKTVDTAISGTAVDLNHPMAQWFQNDPVIDESTESFGASGFSPGGVSWTTEGVPEERKAKWRKRFRMKGRKNV